MYLGDLENVDPEKIFPTDIKGSCRYRQKTYGLSNFLLNVDYCSGSDYSGVSLETANFRELMDYREENDSPFIVELSGIYGSFGIGVRLDCDDPELIRIIAALDDYPIINEERISIVENEAEEEAWENWLCSDFRSAIETTFGVDTDSINNETLQDLYYALGEKTNTYGFCKTGNSWWIDIDRLITGLDSIMLLSVLIKSTLQE